MQTHVDRPLTGWGDRYVKGHMHLLTQEESYQWFMAMDEFKQSLQTYVNNSIFIGAPIQKQRQLLTEFAQLWNLPYGTGLLQLLHHYQHIYMIDIFAQAWKAFYYKMNDYFCISIITPKLLQTKDIDIVLDVLHVKKDKCIISQHIAPKLLGGLIIECNGWRYDTSASGQLKKIKRNLI